MTVFAFSVDVGQIAWIVGGYLAMAVLVGVVWALLFGKRGGVIPPGESWQPPAPVIELDLERARRRGHDRRPAA